MADLKGLKRICMSCGARFYDLNKKPIICPSCGTEYTGEVKVKSRRGRLPADAVNDEIEDDDIDDVVVKTVEVDEDEDVEDDTVSLEDIETDDDADDEDLLAIDDDLDDDLDDLDDDIEEDIAEDDDDK